MNAKVVLAAVAGLVVTSAPALGQAAQAPVCQAPAATHPSAPKTAGLSMLLPELRMWDTFDTGAKMLGRPSDLSADGTGGAYFTRQCVYYASPNDMDGRWRAEPSTGFRCSPRDRLAARSNVEAT
jgi:hypothetical protein